MKTFRLTYQTVTEQSAEQGDFAHHGFISRNGNYNPERNYFPKTPAEFSLRDALAIFQDHGGHIEANECPVTNPRWLDNCRENCDDDCLSITIGLHFPDSLTASTRRRIARYVGCYGIRKS